MVFGGLKTSNFTPPPQFSPTKTVFLSFLWVYSHLKTKTPLVLALAAQGKTMPPLQTIPHQNSDHDDGCGTDCDDDVCFRHEVQPPLPRIVLGTQRFPDDPIQPQKWPEIPVDDPVFLKKNP
jgi:hypothetical protein